MEAPWLASYKYREWKVYKMTPEDYDRMLRPISRALNNPLEIIGYNSESEAMKERWERNKSIEKLFFYDIELSFGMGIDGCYGTSGVEALTGEWRGHPAGSLVLICYKGLGETPMSLTIGVTL